MSNEAQTKFLSLAVGQRFSWRGRRYVKTSPLLACAEDTGQSQMIPRSALVELAESSAPAPVAAATHPGLTALENFHQAALAGVETLAAEATPKTVARVRRELQTAYQRAVKSLEGKD